jgi:hypothetical protein
VPHKPKGKEYIININNREGYNRYIANRMVESIETKYRNL